MSNADTGRRQVFADAELCYAIINICLELGLDEIGIKLENDVRAALRPFYGARHNWVGNNGGRRGR